MHQNRLISTITLGAALLGMAMNHSPAAERCVFPNDPSVLDVKRDFGAKGDGQADDTAALQAGLAASSSRGREGGTKIRFLPNGTYRVTSNLVVKAAVGPWVYGESRDGVIIRLADGVPTNVTAVLRAHPNESKETSADFFMRNFRNLTFDVGENPHVDGVRWYGNNSGILKNVRVIGTGSVGINSGWLGQNGPNLIQDALVEGSFETGVRCAWSWGQTLSRVTVRKARAVGVYVNSTAIGIEDLAVADTPVALHNEYPNDWKWWGGVVALTGGRFTGSDTSQPAITNTSVLYARNVTSRGFKQVLHSTTAGGSVTRASLDEYLSHPAKKLFTNAPDAALQLPIRPEPVVPWESNLSHWVCANDHGAKFGDNRDDTAAIQAAIDAAAGARKTVVYLRGIGGGDPNWYDVKGDVRVHGSVRLLIGLGFGRVVGGEHGRFIVDDASAPVVKFMHLQAFGARPPLVENRSSTNTLVVESCDLRILGAGGGDIFATDCPSRIELRLPGQRLWARQLNPEGDSDTGLVQNHGGVLWALGVKHEGRGVRFLTDQGGQTEILGLFNYAPNVPKDDLRPAFDVTAAAFSAAGVREISFGNTFPVKVRETRAGDVRTEKGGGWIGWAIWRSGTSTPGAKAQAKEASVKVEHVTVFHRPGVFAAWPANGGLWTWDNGQEALVGFCAGRFKEQPGHNIIEPYTNVLARTRDGGVTWKFEPAPGYVQEGNAFATLAEPVNFAHPDFALRSIATGYHGTSDPKGGILFSYDRGQTWKGPFRFAGLAGAAELRDWEITCRTDYMANGASEALLLLSARTPGKSGTDRVFTARTKDGGLRFDFGGWVVGPEDPPRAVMPATVRVSPTRLISAIRRRVLNIERCWVDAYVSNDDGRSWSFLSKVGDTGKGNGNPPALLRLRDGRLCCAYGNRDRNQMLARLSEDDGASWRGELVLRSGYRTDRFGDSDFGYPRLFQRADGQVVCVYYWSSEVGPEAGIEATLWEPGERAQGK